MGESIIEQELREGRHTDTAFLVIDQGMYILGVDSRNVEGVAKEINKLDLSLRRIDGFELARHMRIKSRKRGST